MRRVRFSGSRIALSLAQAMTPKPRNTPHSTIEPLMRRTRLKISYKARNRFRCWRRTYFGKFSSLSSILSGQLVKMRSMFLPTCCSVGVRKVFMELCDLVMPGALDGGNSAAWNPDDGLRISTGDQPQGGQNQAQIDPKGVPSDILETQPDFLRMNLLHVVLIGVRTALQDFTLVSEPN